MGEYRGIMNLCRVLPKGTLSKLAVDDAIDRCTPQIGNIREDIRKCKEIAETRVSSPTRSVSRAHRHQTKCSAIPCFVTETRREGQILPVSCPPPHHQHSSILMLSSLANFKGYSFC